MTTITKKTITQLTVDQIRDIRRSYEVLGSIKAVAKTSCSPVLSQEAVRLCVVNDELLDAAWEREGA